MIGTFSRSEPIARSMTGLSKTALTIGLVTLIFYSFNCLQANTFVVSSLGSFESAQSSASSGDTIIWKQGLYYNVNLRVSKSNLVILAEVPGKTVFTGASKAYFGADYITFSGFQFLNGNIGTDHVIQVAGSYCHFTQLNIRNYYCMKYFILSEMCQYDTLSFCNFEQRAYIGNQNILSVLVSSQKPGYNTIKYCSFKNFEGTGGDMGVEPIRIGLSTQGEYISRTTVEYCYFTQCSGDGEIISHKSRQNVYRYNTFENNPLGELTLRHGDQGVVYGNFFLNGMGGVRIKEGQDHVVFNNYFSGLTSRSINLMNYDVDPLANITIAFNTIVNSEEFTLGGPGPNPPTNITIANNIFAYPRKSIFDDETGTENWIGNISFGSLGIIKPEGIREGDPGLELNSEGYYGLSAGSTAIDSAQAGYPVLPNYPGMGIDYEVSYDLMKQQRPADIALKDIGSSEYPQEITIKPYATENNTGPDYLHNQNFVILDISKVGQGTVILDPPSGVYEMDTQVTITAIPGTYELFAGWGGDLAGKTNPITIVMDGNKKITANFELLPLNNVQIYVEGSGHVDIDPPGWSHPDSTLITLTAVPDSGFRFNGWTGHLSSSENPLQHLLMEDLILFVSFIPDATGIRNDRLNGYETEKYNVQIFPNPTGHFLRITFTNSIISGLDISIVDQRGSLLNSSHFDYIGAGNQFIDLDVSGLPVGLYTIRMDFMHEGIEMKYHDQRIVRRFLKQ